MKTTTANTPAVGAVHTSVHTNDYGEKYWTVLHGSVQCIPSRPESENAEENAKCYARALYHKLGQREAPELGHWNGDTGTYTVFDRKA